MFEVLPNQDFYPFGHLRQLKRLDRKSVSPRDHDTVINAAVCRWKFEGINVDFRLFVSPQAIRDLPNSETPLGNIPVDLDFHNGLYTIRKGPLDISVEYKSRNLELLKSAQWYMPRFVLGNRIYEADTQYDWDLVFDEPMEEFAEGSEILLAS